MGSPVCLAFYLALRAQADASRLLSSDEANKDASPAGRASGDGLVRGKG
jgi:hypothetical protein